MVRPASLEEEMRTVIEEARMVLPGIQAFLAFSLLLSLITVSKSSRIQSKFYGRQGIHPRTRDKVNKALAQLEAEYENMTPKPFGTLSTSRTRNA